jgi:hypothetical protein
MLPRLVSAAWTTTAEGPLGPVVAAAGTGGLLLGPEQIVPLGIGVNGESDGVVERRDGGR